ncbi:MAG: hypothetical protein ACTHU0_05180 [Kofleriaceae bacterium]
MRVVTTFLLFATGIAIGNSCGDSSLARVDASVDAPIDSPSATCDCPAAEPPLDGRIVVVNDTWMIAANDTGTAEASCPSGARILSGSCTTEVRNPIRDVTVRRSGFFEGERSWGCDFRNNESTPVAVKSSVICLVPPP